MTKPLSKIIGVTFIVQIIIFVFGIINNIILSRWLGAEMLGLLAIVVVLVEIVYKIANPGFEAATLYFLSNRKFSVNKIIGNYFFNLILIFLFGTIILLIIVSNNMLELVANNTNKELIVAGLWAIIVYYFAFHTFEFGNKIYLGLQDFKSFNQFQLIKPIVLFVLLMISYFLLRVELNLVLAIIAVSWLIPAIVIWIRQVPFEFGFDRKISIESFRYGLKVMLGNLFQYLVYRSDMLLIGFFISQTAVGWYYISVIIAERLLYLTQATGTIFLPAASHAGEQHQKTPILSRANLFVVIIASVFTAVLSPWLIPTLFSHEYVNSVLPLILLLPGMASLSVIKILSADLAARGKPQLSMYIAAVNLCLNVVLNIILIPKIGINGAAISSSISYSVAAIVECFLFKKITGIPVNNLIFIRRTDFRSILKI